MNSYFELISNLDFWVLIPALFGIFCGTALGFIPNHNDFFFSLLVINHKSLGLELYILFILYVVAIGIADTVILLLGKNFGHKLLKKDFVLKKVSEERQLSIKKGLQGSAFWTALTLRICPFFRPVFILVTGSFDINLKSYFKHYAYILPLYVLSLVVFFYYGSSFISSYLNEYKWLGYALMMGAWLLVIRLAYSSVKKHSQ